MGRRKGGRRKKKSSSKKAGKLRRASMKKACKLLRQLCGMKSDDIQTLLPYLNKAARKVIYECLYNCVFNNRIEETTRRTLRRKLAGNEKTVTYLANPSNCPEKKKKLLRQRGGAFLPVILSTLVPLIISLFTGK
jgi:hypothetical protein